MKRQTSRAEHWGCQMTSFTFITQQLIYIKIKNTIINFSFFKENLDLKIFIKRLPVLFKCILKRAMAKYFLEIMWQCSKSLLFQEKNVTNVRF